MSRRQLERNHEVGGGVEWHSIGSAGIRQAGEVRRDKARQGRQSGMRARAQARQDRLGSRPYQRLPRAGSHVGVRSLSVSLLILDQTPSWLGSIFGKDTSS